MKWGRRRSRYRVDDFRGMARRELFRDHVTPAAGRK